MRLHYIKSLTKIFCMTLTMLIMQSAAHAYGIFWYDLNSDIGEWKKVVIFPLANSNDKNTYLIDRNENSLLYWENKHLMERFEKKIKNLHTVRLAPGIDEEKEILVDKYSVLLQPYPNEKARAEAVFEQTGADMYILPRFKEKRIQKDISPSKTVTVEMRSWTEEKNGPDGNRTYDEKKWTVTHVIPEKEIFLHIMELEFEGYDTEANKVLTFIDSRREYNVDDKHQFRNITKYIRKDFGDIKSGKRNDKGKSGIKTIGFKDLKLPSNVGSDEFALKGAYFGMKIEALDKLKNFKVIVDPKSNESLDYYVTGSINNWEMRSIWHEPYASTSKSLVESKESKWYDKNGKEHKMTTKKYKTEIIDNFAYWEFKWNVNANFQLINTKTGQVEIIESKNETDDKIMDAYRHILASFYGKINKQFGKN